MKKLKKGRKKKKKKKKESTKNLTSKKSLNKIYSKRMDSAKRSYEATKNKLKEELKKHRIENILTSLFISSIWIPNISSQVKHQFLYSIPLSIDSKDFKNQDENWDYDQFSSLLAAIYKLLPSFPTVEDYIPEPDWGEIKFYLKDNYYKMFYGNELSNVYEYLTLFEMVFGSYDNEFIKTINRSPINEMEAILRLQNFIIEKIDNKKISDYLDIHPGHIEIPTVTFFDQVSKFLSEINVKDLVSNEILQNYSQDIEAIRKEKLDWAAFGDKIITGQFLSFLFLIYKDKYFPVLPRRFTSILFDSWSKIFERHSKDIQNDEKILNVKVGSKLYKYFKKRVRTDAFFPVTSAIDLNGKPHHFLYNFSFISKDRLILINLLPLSYSAKQIEEYFEENISDLKESLNLASKQPVTLALHLSKENVEFQSKIEGKTLNPHIISVIPQVSTQIWGIKSKIKIPGTVMFLDGFLGIADEMDDVDDLSEFLDFYEKPLLSG